MVFLSRKFYIEQDEEFLDDLSKKSMEERII